MNVHASCALCKVVQRGNSHLWQITACRRRKDGRKSKHAVRDTTQDVCHDQHQPHQ